MFINFTNHESEKWSQEQLLAAKELARGEIIDIQFPNVNPRATREEVSEIARKSAYKMLPFRDNGERLVILVQGEMTFTHHFLMMMDFLASHKKFEVLLVAATSERIVTETVNPDGTTSKSSEFRFVQFRSY